jgi:hypothetical protein
MAIGPLLSLAAKRSLGCRPALCLLVVSSAELPILTSSFLILIRIASSRGRSKAHTLGHLRQCWASQVASVVPHCFTSLRRYRYSTPLAGIDKCRAALLHLDVDTVIPLLLPVPVLTSVVPHCFTSLRRLLLNALWFGLVTLVWFGLVGFCCQDSLALLSSYCAHVPGAHDWP